jgi:hypothetical protein
VNIFGNSTAVQLVGSNGDMKVLGKIFPAANIVEAFDFACKNDARHLLMVEIQDMLIIITGRQSIEKGQVGCSRCRCS